MNKNTPDFQPPPLHRGDGQGILENHVSVFWGGGQFKCPMGVILSISKVWVIIWLSEMQQDLERDGGGDLG